MPDTLMTDRVTGQAAALARDHAQLFVDLAVRLEPYLGELATACVTVYQSVQGGGAPESILREQHAQALRVLFDSLRQGSLQSYWPELSAWALRMAGSGVPYDRVLSLVGEYRRVGLPFLLRVYPVSAELGLVLGALDDLYIATVLLVGAAYVQMAQDGLVRSVRLRTVGELASGAAHSINNLLTSILGHAQLLLDRVSAPETRDELIQIQRAASLGAQMVGRLQEYAAPKRDEKMAETDMNEVVRQAAEVTRFLWRDQAEANGIVVDVVKDLGDVPLVLARTGELREVMVTLILNAVQAMPNGGLISLRTERRGDDVWASVVDTGEGIPEEIRQRIFDPFFTTKGAVHPGLGLTVAQKIVQDHQGSFAVDSHLGRGSTFTVALPVAPGTTAPAEQQMPAPARAAAILIVDDEPTVRDILAKFLRFRGYQVTVANGGSEGIAALKQTRFDLVLTDLGMPGKSGWDVARQVKRLYPTTLVVLMTGWAADIDPEKAKESGVDRIVHKPFDVDMVQSLVTEALTIRDKLRVP